MTATLTPLPVPSKITLTVIKQQVLRHVVEGKSNKQIGRALGISPYTVKTHIRRLLEILEASGRTQLLRRAIKLGLLAPDELFPTSAGLIADTPGSGFVALREREQQMLYYLSFGYSNQRIGQEIYLSENTVKSHVKTLFRRIKAHNRAHAVYRGALLGLLELEGPA